MENDVILEKRSCILEGGKKKIGILFPKRPTSMESQMVLLGEN